MLAEIAEGFSTESQIDKQGGEGRDGEGEKTEKTYKRDVRYCRRDRRCWWGLPGG